LPGDSVPKPLGFIASVPIPVKSLCRWGSAQHWPQPGLGPGVGAQLASQQRLLLRPGRLQRIRSNRFEQSWNEKNSLIIAALSDMADNGR